MADLEIEPLKDLNQLFEANIDELPRAEVRQPFQRGCKFKVVRDGTHVRIDKADENASKTLVCHDMKGGYLEDRFVQGCKDIDVEPYAFVHWSLVDLFVYFSHHFITIPPLGWIEAGHKNGVQILGTIITEFKPGGRICKELLKDKGIVDAFVEKCVKIAKMVGFDGWLLNIENEIEKEDMENLFYLVEQLTKKMHDQVSNSQVIWYDSVTIHGDLQWQNELNDLNASFFDSCDGIFLNYTWTEEKLANSFFFNPGRRQDIFVGIDVFGRGCPGGGGFDCNQALTMIQYHNLSAAIFAQGWTHECCGKDETFQERDRKFWKLLEPLLFHQGGSEKIENEGCNPGFGLQEDDEKWWLDLRKQTRLASLNQMKYLACDIPISNQLKIKVEMEEAPLPETKLSATLLFDFSLDPVSAGASVDKDHKCFVFHIETPPDSQHLHFITFQCPEKIRSISIN